MDWRDSFQFLYHSLIQLQKYWARSLESISEAHPNFCVIIIPSLFQFQEQPIQFTLTVSLLLFSNNKVVKCVQVIRRVHLLKNKNTKQYTHIKGIASPICESLEEEPTPEEGPLHLAPAVEIVEQATSIEANLGGCTWMTLSCLSRSLSDSGACRLPGGSDLNWKESGHHLLWTSKKDALKSWVGRACVLLLCGNKAVFCPCRSGMDCLS